MALGAGHGICEGVWIGARAMGPASAMGSAQTVWPGQAAGSAQATRRRLLGAGRGVGVGDGVGADYGVGAFYWVGAGHGVGSCHGIGAGYWVHAGPGIAAWQQRRIHRRGAPDGPGRICIRPEARMRPWMVHESQKAFAQRLGRPPLDSSVKAAAEQSQQNAKHQMRGRGAVPVQLPKSHDPRKRWPECSDVIGRPHNQARAQGVGRSGLLGCVYRGASSGAGNGRGDRSRLWREPSSPSSEVDEHLCFGADL